MADILNKIGEVAHQAPAVHESEWRLSAHDIANGGGIATVTLRSGAQFRGTIEKSHNPADSPMATLHLTTDRGWVVIDWTEIAALGGEPR